MHGCHCHFAATKLWPTVQIAKRQGVVNPENTFFSVKRFIGRKMSEVKDESQQVPYRLADSSGAVKIKSSNAGKDFSPEEISAQVLRKLVDDAAKFLNDKVCSWDTPFDLQQKALMFCSATDNVLSSSVTIGCYIVDWCCCMFTR